MPETIADILRNSVKEKLARGEVVASMTVRLVSNIEIASLARTAGFDTLYIDVEHSSFSLATTSQICIAALAVGIAPFVRVPSIRPEHVGRVLDGGALGVIAPHIRSAEEARAVVRAANSRRSASAPPPAACRTCATVTFRRPRPTRRSTTRPPSWSSARAPSSSTTRTRSWVWKASTWR